MARAHEWHPNQLRHSFATTVRATEGPEAAQVLLGHSHINTTEIYAEKNAALGKPSRGGSGEFGIFKAWDVRSSYLTKARVVCGGSYSPPLAILGRPKH